MVVLTQKGQVQVKYTTDKPTSPGYYWIKYYHGSGHITVERIIEVFDHNGLRMFFGGENTKIADMPQRIEWAGPIESPTN